MQRIAQDMGPKVQRSSNNCRLSSTTRARFRSYVSTSVAWHRGCQWCQMNWRAGSANSDGSAKTREVKLGCIFYPNYDRRGGCATLRDYQSTSLRGRFEGRRLLVMGGGGGGRGGVRQGSHPSSDGGRLAGGAAGRWGGLDLGTTARSCFRWPSRFWICNSAFTRMDVHHWRRSVRAPDIHLPPPACFRPRHR